MQEPEAPPVVPPKPPGRKGGRLPALLLGLLVPLLLGECYARWRHGHPPLPPEEHQAAPPGMFVNDDAAGFRLAASFAYDPEHFTTNALGLRDRDREVGPPPTDVVRVALIGDSFPTGVAVADEHHLARLLEDALLALPREGDTRVEVWNLGVPHYGNQQAMLQLLDRWNELQPQVVVLSFFEGNDPFDETQGPSFHAVVDRRMTRAGWAPWPGDPYNDQRAELNRPVLAHHLPGDGLLNRWSYLYRLVMRGVHAARYELTEDQVWPWGMEPFDYEAFGGVAWLYLDPPPPPIEGGWAITKDVLRTLKREVEGRGARLLLMSAPAKISVHYEDLGRAMEEGWENGFREGGGSADGMRPLDPALPGRRITAVAQDLDLVFLDLLPALRDAGESERMYYFDDSHWTAAGHRVAALELGRALSERAWIPPVADDALRGALEGLVPPGSAHDVFEGGFRPELGRDRGGDDDDDRGDERGKGGKGGKGLADSEIPPRLVDPSRLLPLLPPPPAGWTTTEDARAEVGPLKYPRDGVVVAFAEQVYEHEDGRRATAVAYDSAGQPELDAWWSGEAADRVVLGPVPAGMRRSTARIGVLVEEGEAELLEAIDAEQVAALERELRPSGPEGALLDTLIIGREKGGPPRETRERLVDPASLVAALPPAPEGWEILDTMPMYRPHAPHDGDQALPERIEVLYEESEALHAEDEIAWSAQPKRWYRGPQGSFAFVLQDSGMNEELLRAREGRMLRAWGVGAIENVQPDEHGVTLAAWEGAGLRGFRTCMEAQGLCKVVAPVVDAGDPRAPLARFNVILMGPPDAPDSAYEALIAGLKRDALPADPLPE